MKIILKVYSWESLKIITFHNIRVNTYSPNRRYFYKIGWKIRDKRRTAIRCTRGIPVYRERKIGKGVWANLKSSSPIGGSKANYQPRTLQKSSEYSSWVHHRILPDLWRNEYWIPYQERIAAFKVWSFNTLSARNPSITSPYSTDLFHCDFV